MRTLTSGQLAVLNSMAYQVGVQLWIADGDGIMRDYIAQGGWNWIDSIEIDVTINQPISQATINLRRDVTDGSGTIKSLSPLRTDSSLNRNGVGAFAPAIDAGRAVRIMVATTAVGTAPVSGDWQNLFEGTLDDWDIAKNPIVLTARDAGGALQDALVAVATNYPASDVTPIETVVQQVMTDWVASPPTLYCPASPGYDITPGGIQVQSVMDTELYFAGLPGFDFRYWWDEGTASWRPTLQAIPRTKTTPDRTIAKARVIDVSQAKASRVDVRNRVWVWYVDASTGVLTKAEVFDSASIAKYGDRLLIVTMPEGSPITTMDRALIYAGNLLADLKDPLLDQIIDMPLDWSVELNDLHTYTGNGIHYTSDQSLAVVAYKHTISATQQRTQVECKGAPCGPYLGWLALASTPAGATITPTLDNLRIVSEDDASVTYGWVEGAGTAEVWAAYRTFASPVPEDPWTTVAAAVLPLSTNTFVIPKPAAGSITFAQIEPRSAALVAGAVQRIAVPPGQPPIDFGASPQGTTTVTNGQLSASFDGTQQTLSYKWLASTGGFPTDADVKASDAISNGRQFDLIDILTLDFGETGYLTAVPYSGINATGTPGPSVRLRGIYQSYETTRTSYYSYNGFLSDAAQQTDRGVGSAGGVSAICIYAAFTSAGPLPSFIYRQGFTVPDGATLTDVVQDLYFNDTAGLPTATGVACQLFRVDSSGVETTLGTQSATNLLGWQSLSLGPLIEDTTGNTYLLYASMARSSTSSGTTYTTAGIGGFAVTCIIPNPSVG